ncbi:hypothetical protein Dimus_028294 [Dionaea muscipula]
MDGEMGEFLEGEVSVANEASAVVDFDYEYDAPRCFDFTRPESPLEVDAAECWFQSAKSYPPSPFIVRLNLSMDGETSSNKSSDHKTTYSSDNDGHGRLKPKSKSPLKPFFPRSSTLLKPTASHLAKQNIAGILSTKLVGRLHQTRSPQKPCGEIDATKRQKLEIGYLRRAAQLKHQTLFSHKSPKKVILMDTNAPPLKSKVTIPKEPDLVTAYRAQKYRSRNTAQQESNARSNVRSFKARPLNRKILEGPSLSQPKKSTPLLPEFQVFHLRTSERAMQQVTNNVQMEAMQSSNSTTQSGVLDIKRTNSNALKQETSEAVYRFKARPLNKKILSSKGDVGVFRNRKQEATIPKVFNFSRQKPPDPPIELFNKLSLTCENQPEDKQHLKIKVFFC